MEDDIVTTLEVKYFAGFVPGTEHFYGELCGSVDGEYKRIDVKGRLTEHEAKALNRVDSWQGHKEGMLSIRFSSKERLFDTARSVYRVEFPESLMLAVGLHAASEPKLVLDCAVPEIEDRAKELYARAEEIGWYRDRKNYDLMDEIVSIWESLIEILRKWPIK